MRMTRRYGLWVMLLASFALHVAAAEISILPLRLDLSADRNIASLKVTNRGAEPVIMQLALKHWTMVEGEDIYVPADDLIATPPLFELEPAGQQVIRVGFRGEPPAESEQAYRLFLEQVLPDAELGEDQVVRVTLRFGVPVFVKPAQPVHHDIEWDLTREAGDRLRLVARNTGNTHYRITHIKLQTPEGSSVTEAQGVFYLLPGSRREWVLTPPGPIMSGTYRLTAENSAGTVVAELTLP